MHKILTYSSYLAAVAIISMSQAQAACGGGGFSSSGKTTTSAPRATATIQAAHVETMLYSTRFDSVSSQLDLSSSQSKEISRAKSDINDKNDKLVKAQSKAQRKLDGCDGNCADEMRNLARSTDELKSYNTSNEFNLRLRSILRPSQNETYLHS